MLTQGDGLEVLGPRRWLLQPTCQSLQRALATQPLLLAFISESPTQTKQFQDGSSVTFISTLSLKPVDETGL